LCDTDHLVFSNRSAAYGSQQMFAEALTDAQKCTKLRPEWAKGYARLGYAYYHLGKLQDSKKAYLDGLKQEPTNEGMKDGLKEVEQALEKESKPATVRSKRKGIKGTLSKLVNPLGLSTTGAIIYVVSVITIIGLVVLYRAGKFQAAVGGADAGDMDAGAEDL